MVALITGSGSGIGKACAMKFAQEGYDLALVCNRSVDGAKELKAFAENLGLKAEIFRADLSDSKSIAVAVSEIKKCFGTPDVIVNDAGYWAGGQLQDIEEDVWDRIMSVNIKAMYLICRAFADDMIFRHSGNIVNISSMWGQSGASCESAYSASKGAVDAFTKSLAKELGPSGIRVNAVSPGVILTDMCAGYSAETMAELAGEAALGRNGTPEDVAKAVYFLASDSASFITGQILGVNGGIQI